MCSFAGLKRDHRACATSVDDGLCRAPHASDRDRFAVIIDVLKVGPGRNENDIAGVGNINGLLNGGLIGWNVDGRRRNGASNQTE